uniref:3-dehydroquinate dehydratase n=1 Tax=Desulfobacca acetoxidans TaxID=60893 RepID=A0A7V4G849_9BACT
MRSKLLTLAVLASVGLGTSAEAASNPQTVVSTDVTTNTTWSGEILLDGPVVVTNRPTREGGRWSGSEKARLALLADALPFGVHALDVEFSADPGFRRDLFLRKGPTKLILSWHEFQETPEDGKLEEIFTAMLREKADILKLVTWAHQPQDNLRLLGLIPRARAAGKEIIAFCMGPLGKWSRLAAPFLGSFLSYAPLQRGKTSAPGQVTVNEMRRLFRLLRP